MSNKCIYYIFNDVGFYYIWHSKYMFWRWSIGQNKKIRILLWVFTRLSVAKWIISYVFVYLMRYSYMYLKVCVPSSSRELSIVVGHHDVVSLRKLLCSGILPLLHHLQVQWPVSVCGLCIYTMEVGHMILLHCFFYVLLNSICFDTEWLLIIFLAML